MQQNLQNKVGLVEGVFNKVYDKYDLMNDFMSFGIHRLWKKNLMNWMNPSKDKKYLDSYEISILPKKIYLLSILTEHL